eukprot:CAMPEP_0205913234 /NCGR_PEP_ID=MMETSP1325-20131115/6396_1 /ASSEMBLY_ACC=CAM_ASM_000708 /TAXON_ID=236786 /ORGANISM="Florenciella sp., Strain RCC1007" /LENGTH=98 /DNA_ID=CAMNT_0053280063 /DNA_START=154 /DNA_END=448 /DNA_ORIENTATION=+
MDDVERFDVDPSRHRGRPRGRAQHGHVQIAIIELRDSIAALGLRVTPNLKLVIIEPPASASHVEGVTLRKVPKSHECLVAAAVAAALALGGNTAHRHA